MLRSKAINCYSGWCLSIPNRFQFRIQNIAIIPITSIINCTIHSSVKSRHFLPWVRLFKHIEWDSVRPRSHVPVFDRPGADRAGDSTTWNFKTSAVLTGGSNDQERCDQAVVHAQWSAKDRNSITTLFLLYRCRKYRRNRLHWVHPIIQKKGRIRHLLHTIWWTTRWRKQVFLIIFECLFRLSTRCIAVWRTVFRIVTVKWGTAFNL
jgi:hypothetical protein